MLRPEAVLFGQTQRQLIYSGSFIVGVLLASSSARAVNPEPPPSHGIEAQEYPEICKLLKQKSETSAAASDTGFATAEVRQEFRKLCGGKTAGADKALRPKGSFASLPAKSAPPLAPATPVDKTLDPNVRRFFVSRDSVSTLGEFAAFHQQGRGVPVASPLGATLTATVDELKATQQYSGQAYLGYCIVCASQAFSDYTSFSVGPALIVDGSLTNPLPAKPPLPTSALRVGPDLALDGRFQNSDFSVFLDVLPFFQTDFRGVARMGGLQLLAEPVDPSLHLRVDPFANSGRTLGFIWRIVPEADLMYVSVPGSTNYLKGTYDWIGGNAQATFIPFEGMTKDQTFAFLSRFSFVITYKYLVNASNTQSFVRSSQYELDYKLGADASPENGGPSISLAYATGTDLLTLQNQQQYKLSLAYKY
jgi:hypothetical protein